MQWSRLGTSRWGWPDRGRWLDWAIVSFVLVVSFSVVWIPDPPFGTPITGSRWLFAWWPLMLALPLLWRRSYPLACLSVILAAVLAETLVNGHSAEGLEFVVALTVGSYSVAAYSTRPRAFAGLALLTVTYAIDANGDRGPDADQGWALAFWGLILVAAWLIGFAVRGRREVATLAVEAAERDLETKAAVAHERVRIARELHDIIAHSVSVIGLQAGAAERMLDRDPERAREPLKAIQDSARDTVQELRRLLGILREGDDAMWGAPQPQLAELDGLLDQVRATGLPVEYRVEGVPQALSPGLELSIYRVVQEALTNVRKHAGATGARVSIRFEPESISVEITDDGQGKSSDNVGHGLVGMRERVLLYNGALTAGSDPGGGFTVRAVMPRERADA